MNTTDRRRLFRTYPVLEALPPELLRKVEQEAEPARAEAGQQMFGEGNPCTHYPMLVEGVIRVSKFSADGREILLYHLNPGESCVITVVTLLGETSYPAAGIAESELSLFSIRRPLFVEMVLTCAPFRVFVFDSMSRRIAHLMAVIDDVAFRRVDQRLAWRLLVHEEPIMTTHQMLADELGTTREVVSRILEAFQQTGMVQLGRKRIEILDRDALVRLHGAEARVTQNRGSPHAKSGNSPDF